MSSTKKISEKTFWRVIAKGTSSIKHASENKEIQFILEATGYSKERIKELVTIIYKDIEVIELIKLNFNPFASALEVPDEHNKATDYSD